MLEDMKQGGCGTSRRVLASSWSADAWSKGGGLLYPTCMAAVTASWLVPTTTPCSDPVSTRRPGLAITVLPCISPAPYSPALRSPRSGAYKEANLGMRLASGPNDRQPCLVSICNHVIITLTDCTCLCCSSIWHLMEDFRYIGLQLASCALML